MNHWQIALTLALLVPAGLVSAQEAVIWRRTFSATAT
jgi:hypothetical protein